MALFICTKSMACCTMTSLLIHTLGEEARKVYNSFSWTSEGDEWKVDKIVEKLCQM